jgi:ribokinase
VTPRTAVVGHVEWVTFARVERVPTAGEIVHADDIFEVPAGGGSVAAVQLHKLAGACTFYTALGDDELGRRSRDELTALGPRVETTFRPERQRRAFTHVDTAGERTITVMGARLGPHADDPLPWDELDGIDGAYFCAGDDDSLRRARRAKTLVVTSREAARVARAGVYIDAVVGSARDASETYIPSEPRPGVVVETLGEAGGRYRTKDGRTGTFGPGRRRGPAVCAYGAGDSFVAGLTFALARGDDLDVALRVAADCGAACLSGRGPYAGQLTAADL